MKGSLAAGCDVRTCHPTEFETVKHGKVQLTLNKCVKMLLQEGNAKFIWKARAGIYYCLLRASSKLRSQNIQDYRSAADDKQKEMKVTMR